MLYMGAHLCVSFFPDGKYLLMLIFSSRSHKPIMSDTDSIKTDKSQSDLQQKYDKLAMEFAKVNITLKLKIN